MSGLWWRRFSIFSLFTANNARLFCVIPRTISLSSQRRGKKWELAGQAAHAMLRRLSSLQGIYPLLLWLILCGLQVSERSPITSASYKWDSWCFTSFPFTDLEIYYVSTRRMTARSFYATWNHLPNPDLKAFSFELNSSLSLTLMPSRNLQLLK